MTDYLRFLMSADDRDRIDPASVQLTEVPFEPYPTRLTDAWPESMRLKFRVNDPQNGAPRLRMILPAGWLRFDPVLPLNVPEPPDVQFDANGRITAAMHRQWPNIGRLRLLAVEWTLFTALRRWKMPGIGLGPTIAWFDPIEIPLDFLNDALLGAQGLERLQIGLGAGAPPMMTSDPNWPARAVSAFYKATYEPHLRVDAPAHGHPDRTRDDVARLPMPRMVMTGAGDVDLTITLAASRERSELTADYIGDNFPGADRNHPGSNQLEAIPARGFLREFRASMIGADAGNVVVDAIVGPTAFLTSMKQKLKTAGFGNLGTTPTLEPRTTWAIREFQIASKAPSVGQESIFVATEYAMRLTEHANDLHQYTGPINGQLNARTRRCLDWWLLPASNYRSAVVVTARQPNDWQQPTPNGGNLWAADDLVDDAPRMFVRDLSRRYPIPSMPDARDIVVGNNRFIVLGYYDNAGGPNMTRDRHSWSTMEFDSQVLMNIDEATLATDPTHATKWSTYLTILPTVDRESSLRFDVTNAWDSATISIPLFHYTLKYQELGGFLCYLRYRSRSLFDAAIGAFGIRPVRNWPDTADRAQAKHGSEIEAMLEPGARYSPWPDTDVARAYFKTWHWFYRFVMAARVFDDWKRIAYDFARIRLSDLRAVKMTGKPSTNPAIVPNSGASGIDVTVGEVFTSELAMGMLLRWHVKRTAGLVVDGHADNDLWGALRRAQATSPALDWHLPVAAWTSSQEAALIAGLQAQTADIPNATDRATLQTHLAEMPTFARQNMNLSPSRGSLQFDAPPM